MSFQEPAPAAEPTFTTWHNPTAHEQRVTIHGDHGYGGAKRAERPRVYVIAPGGSKQIPSEYDTAIQRVQCAHDECRRVAPGWCRKGHPGVVLGGIAPLLVKVDGADVALAPGLDPDATRKKELEAEQARAELQRKSADDAVALAEVEKQRIGKRGNRGGNDAT